MTEELLRQGIAAAKAGRKEEAFRLLMQVTEIDEENERAWLWLSQVVDSPEDRVVCLENVLAINPDNANARAGLAWLAKSGAPVTGPEPVPADQPASGFGAEPCPRCGGPVSLAQNDCPRCGLPMIVLCPRCRSHVEVVHSSCPTCQFTIGDFRAGAAYHLALAQAYIGEGKSDLAPGATAYAYREAANDPQVLMRVAELYVDLGDPDSALPALEEASAAAGTDAGLQAQIGLLYQRLNRPDQARAAFEQSTQVGSDPAALLELARLELSEGHAAEARDLLQQVIKARPLDAEGYLLLGDAERALGHKREAGSLYAHASKLTPRETAVGRKVFSRLIEAEGQSEAAARADWRRQERDERETGRRSGSRRPGCITLYAAWLALSALLGLCSIPLVMGLPNFQDPAVAAQLGIDAVDLEVLPQLMPFVIGISLVYVGVQGALAGGLWFMKNWARIIMLVLQGISFILQLIGLILIFFVAGEVGIQSDVPSILPIACGPLGNMAVQAVIIFWFATNGERFS